uniref:Uncharacterized protein n=1 Tax=Schistosoma japonicum TaxID=6182 RepID=B5M6Z6_SCHJA|nr:hypothetical protein [Schistosoma japonicum]
MKTIIWLLLLVCIVYGVVNIEGDRKVVIFRGAKSYPGYRGNHRIQETSPTNRRVDISKVQLYGARKNDPTYRQGLEDLAGLMK